MHRLMFIFLLFASISVFAQDLIVVNGGVFGSNQYANFTTQSLGGGSLSSIDTIYTNSIQDVLIDGQFAYVAAQDSIIKYNLANNSRVAAIDFGAVSTIKLAVHNGFLLAGNWYAPWGQLGPYTNHFRVFNASDLSFVDSIASVTKPATDFVVHDNIAYIAQNNAKTVGFGDTLGYIAVVDLTSMTLLRNDTLSGNGDEIGRMILEGDMLYTLNGSSNTISSYNLNTQSYSTQSSPVNINPSSYGPTAFWKEPGVWYFPFDSGIGSYDLANNVPLESNIVSINGSFAFALDTFNNRLAVSHIDYVNQANNQGVYYDMNGDSVASFVVGYSPEALAVVGDVVGSVSNLSDNNPLDIRLYPNPVADALNIEFESQDMLNAVLYNINGQIMIEKSDIVHGSTLLLNDVPSGVYWLVLKNSSTGKSHATKIVKQ